ncbi:CidB/LrgB family autolysis modulator [Paenibacillus sp. FSL H8-0548]|uniref:LrgB family protein n=1 Tax=Paenibacillus sp. FSL H8-0548 TaxID=1920422 RepID=UPI00096FD456|nr:LrgB family protein [Paenibacillus sp. FSL H8-0548]OMF33766.1 CidB/LrgB family autolysis modulator [Paenibacillus sp. FSL H8-0548]
MIQAALWLIITVVIYLAAKRLYGLFPKVYLTPLLVEPATIALAITLYRHMDILRKNVWVIAISVTAGAVIAIITSVGAAYLFGLDTEVIESLAPRSATTPIAVSISGSIGGVPTITAVATLITGLIGLIAGPLIIKWFGIKSAVARGILFGTSAHSAGISKALEYDAVTGSVASIAMMVTAFVTLLATPWLMGLW